MMTAWRIWLIEEIIPDYQPLACRLSSSDRQALRVFGQQWLVQQVTDQQKDVYRLHFDHNHHGKPIITNASLYFNQSHSQFAYALAWSDQPIGIDIEPLTRQINFLGLAQRYFHPHEYQTWCDHQQCPTFWLQIWTIKEAILKACGVGLRWSLREIDTGAMPMQTTGEMVHPQLGTFAYQCYTQFNHQICVAHHIIGEQHIVS